MSQLRPQTKPAADVIEPAETGVIDLHNRPDEPNALAVWRAKRFVGEIENAMHAAYGPQARLSRAEIFEAGMVVTATLPNGEEVDNHLYDPERVDPDTLEDEMPDPGKRKFLVEEEDGFVAVYPDGDKSRKPRAYDSLHKALTRTLALPANQPLGPFTDELIKQMANQRFERQAAPLVAEAVQRGAVRYAPKMGLSS